MPWLPMLRWSLALALVATTSISHARPTDPDPQRPRDPHAKFSRQTSPESERRPNALLYVTPCVHGHRHFFARREPVSLCACRADCGGVSGWPVLASFCVSLVDPLLWAVPILSTHRPAWPGGVLLRAGPRCRGLRLRVPPDGASHTFSVTTLWAQRT